MDKVLLLIKKLVIWIYDYIDVFFFLVFVVGKCQLKDYR